MNKLARKNRTRFKLTKVSSRKRLSVFRSNNHLYAQIINDEQGTTLACVSSLEKSFQNKKNKSNPLWGTIRAHVANALHGVCEGFSKQLELNGTGYRASVTGSKLKLQLGYSHDIDYEIPKEVKIECPKQNIIKITSIHKEILGAVAAKIRSYRRPEPFKGKGIKYENEFIFRKEGKKK